MLYEVITGCGIRPLAVRAGDNNAERYPLDLSRRQHVVRDATVPWISTYGGKLVDVKCRLFRFKPTRIGPCENEEIFNDPGKPGAFLPNDVQRFPVFALVAAFLLKRNFV